MAYSLYNLEIQGPEIKRRLDLLRYIYEDSGNGVATKVDITEYEADLKQYIENNYMKLPESPIVYIDAGKVTDYIEL